MAVPPGHHSNTHLCNVQVVEYQYARRRGLFVCHGCKGRLVLELFRLVAPNDVTRPEDVRLSLKGLQDGSFLPHYEQVLWDKCGFNFPGLKPLRRSWAKIVLHLAKELASNIQIQDGGAIGLLPTAQTVWTLDAEAAYRWWKAANAERAQARQAVTEAGRLIAGPSGSSTVAPTVVMDTSSAIETNPNGPPSAEQPPTSLDLDALETLLDKLLKQYDVVQESETHAIEYEELKERAQVDLFVATAELNRARPAGDQSEIQRLQRQRDEAGGRARVALNAYYQARICGIPTSDYLNHPERSKVKVIFHSRCKGFILWAVASSHYDGALLDIGDGRAPLTENIDRFLCNLWETNNMGHSGLKVFMETWLGMVVGIAEASVKFSAGSLGEAVLAGWEQDPEEAYRWLKNQMREHQREISDIDSQAPTDLNEMNILQRAQVEEKKREVERRGSVAPPNLSLWLVKNSLMEQWTVANDRILEINERLDTYLDERVREDLVVEGDKLRSKQDELQERYEQAGGGNL
ncbi:hypothetical protein CEP51_015426 [Fusarium floridanum]|uniref:Uncharacterized protein n=1 Tax=Fusarium floridanum TaxID=1325733 RepID=A0A428PA08_9HYPO|nr:hypothetical protein CEP51_015426 [Fusarium floridanum]